MVIRLGSLLAAVAVALLACAGVVLAQPTGSDSGQTTGEELVASTSSLSAGDVIPDSYIVVLKDKSDQSAEQAGQDADQLASTIAQAHDLEVTHVYRNALKGFAARVPSGLDLSSALSNDPNVQFVAQDRVVKASAQTLPTGIDRVEADQSSTKAGNHSGAVDEDIAIIDTGIYKHKDLRISGGYNCVGKDRKAWSDGNGHGTHVAGTAAAKDNDSGVVGVAPRARLWAVKVLDENGSGSFSSVICGIDWVTGKADTIEAANMSLDATVIGTDDGNCGWTGDSAAAAMHQAICNSVDAGVFYAVAAGNDTKDFLTDVPAAFNQVLTVTAMADFDGEPGSTGISSCRPDNQDDTAATFSNYTTVGSSDESHTIAAPGVCIRSTWKGDRYKTISGTSMATPHITGTAALCIWSGDCSGLSPSQIITKLRDDAKQKSDSTLPPSPGPYYGFKGDPILGGTTIYYGYLEYAGGY